MPKNSYGLTADEMLDQLKSDKVDMRCFVSGNKYYMEIEKESEGVKLNVKVSTHEEFLLTVRDAFDKWHSLMDGRIRTHLGLPELEHYTEETPPDAPLDGIEKLHEEAGVKPLKDDEIPF